MRYTHYVSYCGFAKRGSQRDRLSEQNIPYLRRQSVDESKQHSRCYELKKRRAQRATESFHLGLEAEAKAYRLDVFGKP